MSKSLEKLAEEIYKECLKDGEPVTKEEALEMAKMEMKAKDVKNYTQSSVEKKKVTRERKVDEEKKVIIEQLKNVVDCLSADATVKNEAEINFSYGENGYTIKLIKHRKKS